MFGFVIGRLVKDVEFTPAQGQNGRARANFTLAVDRPKKKTQQANQQTADFYDCTAWGTTAEVLANNYVKGDVVVVDDIVYHADQYTDKSGSTRTKHQWTCNHVVPAYTLVSKRQTEMLFQQNKQKQQAGNATYGQQPVQQGQYPQQPAQSQYQQAPNYGQSQYQPNQPTYNQYGQPAVNYDDVDNNPYY